MKNKRKQKTITVGDRVKESVLISGGAQFTRVNRGQTSIDLLLAIVIFFAAIGLLIGQNPTVFFPGNIGASDTTTTSDRIGQELITTELSNEGVTSLNHERTVSFLENAEENPEYMETLFSLSENQGMKVEIVFDSTNDERQVPLALREDNDFEYTVERIGEEENEYSVVVESESFDGSGTEMVKAATLDDRRVTVSVTVGRHT